MARFNPSKRSSWKALSRGMEPLWRSFGYPLRMNVRRDVALEGETGRSSWYRAWTVSLVCQPN